MDGDSQTILAQIDRRFDDLKELINEKFGAISQRLSVNEGRIGVLEKKVETLENKPSFLGERGGHLFDAGVIAAVGAGVYVALSHFH